MESSVLRIGVCGAGRIGRACLSAAADRDMPIQVVVDRGDPARIEELLNLALCRVAWRKEAGAVRVARESTWERPPVHQSERVPDWVELGVDLVVDATGIRQHRAAIEEHLQLGAARVVIAGPCRDVDRTIVIGSNENELRPNDRLVSASSCTVNCIVPVLRALAPLGVETAMTSSIHCVTPDQLVLDGLHRDARLGRGAMNQILITFSSSPSEAATIVGTPVLGNSIRVPVERGAVVEMTLQTTGRYSAAEVNQLLRETAASSPVLATSDIPLSSSDICDCPYSSVVDLTLTLCAGNLVRVSAWHDNEVGYAHRLLDLCALVSRGAVELVGANRATPSKPGENK
jgi:glyceraldehyde 3-phosphate dehydrogenase